MLWDAEIPELGGMREGPESCVHCTSRMLDLVLLKILVIFKQRTSHYHFVLSLSNYVADSACDESCCFIANCLSFCFFVRLPGGFPKILSEPFR